MTGCSVIHLPEGDFPGFIGESVPQDGQRRYPESMSLASGLSATKAGLDLARGVYDLPGRREIDPSEIQARLLEVQSLILEAQRSLGEAEDENRQLKRKIESLQTQDAIQSSLLFAENVYLKRNPEGGLDGRFVHAAGTLTANWSASSEEANGIGTNVTSE